MAAIETVIDNLLKERIGHHLCDSGGAYGYIYERNREEGYPTGLCPVDEYTNDETKERELTIYIPIYDYLTYNLIKDEDTIEFEESLFEAFRNNGFEPSEIYEVEDYLNGDGGILWGISNTGITNIRYINTCNSDEYLTQTLLYVTFKYDCDDYVLLEVHNGCDVRSGYTAPQLFKVKDIESFISGQFDRVCECECGLNDYSFYGSDDPTDSCGDYVTEEEIFERTYVDEDGQVRCKDCGSIVKGGFREW